MLHMFNFPTVALHSMMKQKERFAALAKFKSSIYRTLIATDMASQGLDIPTMQICISLTTIPLASQRSISTELAEQSVQGGRDKDIH